MSCSVVRARLLATSGVAAERDRAHVEGCQACRRFVRRLEAVEALLGERPAEITPDPAFAARVLDRLPAAPADEIGRAALRLLPAALALALVLAGWCLLATPAPRSLLAPESPTEDLVAWVIDDEEAAP